tara:strand:+ start:56 stop:862 length:807 start_codon:yes stop_codon:yes gene_type:complete
MGFWQSLLIKKQILKNSAFIWNSENSILDTIIEINSIDLKLLVAIDKQKNTLFENTKNFAKGNFTNNALLWGSRGNGKSTLIKSIFNKLKNDFVKLRLIQINKNDIFDIEKIYKIISNFPEFRFILYIDDLSFEKIDSDYKIVKSTLDGSIQNQPKNIILYITSNRRHLMPRDMIDNERSSAIHTDESVEEKISLSDRFGLWIGFHNFSQNEYLNIIKTYCEFYKLNFNNEIRDNAVRWSLKRGNRNGRTAWQFIINLAAENDLKLNF